MDGASPSGYWGDFPVLGYDSGQAVYISSNQYSFGNSFQYAKLRILYKSQIYWVGSGGASGQTQMLADTSPGPEDGYPLDLVEAGGQVFFNTASGIWATDGTTQGTRKLGVARPRG